MTAPRIITAVERAARKRAKAQATAQQATPFTSPQITGAGDVFALFAQPIARAVDKVAGTDIANCEPCKKRRARWNKAIPL